MDSVRFGRVLGAGARAAAKTAVAAVHAATAPNPIPPQPRTSATPAPARAVSLIPPPRSIAAAASLKPRGRPPATTVRTRAAGIREGSKRFGREVWNPFVRVSAVLWLEVTGVFFGIFALFAMGAAWRLRWAWHSAPAHAAEHQRLLGAIAMFAVFAWFTVSSFLRAQRRGRRT